MVDLAARAARAFRYTPPMHRGADRGRTARVDEASSERARVEVAAAVIESEGRYLVAQRRPDQTFPLHWEFPGGKREPGESWEACLERELREELDVDARVGALVDAVTHEYADLTVALRFFRCAVLRGEPRPLGCHDLRWAPAAELARLAFPEADASLVAWLAGRGDGGRRAPARRGGGSREVAVRVRGRGPRAAVARVLFAAEARSADVPAGTLLEQAAACAGAGLAFGCRFGICGACAIVVRAGATSLSRPTREERATLRAVGAPPGSRLACAARTFGDVVVERVAADFPLA